MVIYLTKNIIEEFHYDAISLLNLFFQNKVYYRHEKSNIIEFYCMTLFPSIQQIRTVMTRLFPLQKDNTNIYLTRNSFMTS